jgi:hypothetical protein
VKRLIISLSLAIGLIVAGSGAAVAGETNGKGDPIPGAHMAHSACAFSGQDLPDDVENNPPGFDDDAVTGGLVQSYGQLVAAGLKAAFPSPGVACRGNAGHEE